MSSNTIYLITGANRGLGFGLVAASLRRPQTTVIAGVRDVNASSKQLESLWKGEDSKIIVVKLDSKDQNSPATALQGIKNLEKIDVVISNAGIATWALGVDTDPQVVRDQVEVNTIAPLVLFQATLPLLKKSTKPIFIAMSSGAGSMGLMEKYPMLAASYGASKAALNYIMRKLHFENSDVIIFPLSPGWVKTEMGNTGAVAHGMEEAPTTVEDCVNGILHRVDTATRETLSGEFVSFDDMEMLW